MRTKRLNNKGFTLVEVIVVAVIVAVLALVAIQLYQGYVKEARTNTAENLAASAAGFLQSAYNSGVDFSTGTGNNVTLGTSIANGASWAVTLPSSGDDAVFRTPSSASVKAETDGTVTATVKDANSKGTYKWK